MTTYDLDISDVIGIFKNNLKIENSVKSITHTFKNKRYYEKIDYSPYFQRNYVWDEEKATYFIESILLGTEIPPIVLFDNGKANEVIDGRQRFETIKRFIDGEIELREKGLHSLTNISEKSFNDLTEDMQNAFLNTKIRILQFSIVNEPKLSAEKEDKIKKEIFRRYNSGITALKSQEIERAEFINDPTAEKFKKQFSDDPKLREMCINIFVPKTKHNMKKRDLVNYLLSRSRLLLTIPLIPIYSYASGSSKNQIIKNYYYTTLSKRNADELLQEFYSIIEYLTILRNELTLLRSPMSNNSLFFECMYWIFSIIFSIDEQILHSINFKDLAFDISLANDNKIFWKGIKADTYNISDIYFQTGSHYYKSIVNRYTFLANYFSAKYKINFDSNLKNSQQFKNIMETDIITNQFKEFKLNKTDPVSATIYDILDDIKNSKFIIRPDYQRSEVKNIQKASYLMESIILGMKIPPLFIFRKSNKTCEVIDGQQRLLSIIGFLGEQYMDENEQLIASEKNLYKLSKLRILSELNGKNITKLDELDPQYKDKILDFALDIVEINEDQNPDFQAIDLFLRLNTKPYPVKPNTFEMWNAYINKTIVCEIKDLAKKYTGILFQANNTRMKNEELITILAYLAYKRRIEDHPPTASLNIFIKSTNKINSRIANKQRITSMLSNIDKEGNLSVFQKSIDDVILFINKLQILSGEDFSRFNDLIAHTLKNTQSRTNQNFYLLWIILENITKQLLVDNKTKIFSNIQTIFITSRKTTPDFDLNSYIDKITNILN